MNSFYHAYKFVAASISPYFKEERLLKLIDKSRRLNWEQIAYISGNHSVVQSLYPVLSQNKIKNFIPKDFLSYAKELYELNCKRNEILKAQLTDTVSKCNEVGVKPLLMKGAAHLFLNTFSNNGERLLTDLDILVPEKKIKDVSNRLIQSGYSYLEDAIDFIDTHHHYPPLIKQEEFAMIELHRDLMFHEQQNAFPTDLAWEKSIDITLSNNFKAKLLSPTYRIFHSFLHSTMVDKLHQKGYVELRQLHELARTQLMYSSSIDWNEMFSHAQKTGVSRQLHANLYAANKFMDFPKLDKTMGKYLISSMLHHHRVCSKLKYRWFDSIDKKLEKRLSRIKARNNKPATA